LPASPHRLNGDRLVALTKKTATIETDLVIAVSSTSLALISRLAMSPASDTAS